MKQLLTLLLAVSGLAAAAQPYTRFEFRRVQVAPSITTTAYVALPPGYDSLRPEPYPVVFVGKGLMESFASVQANGVFGALRKGLRPDTTKWVFVHLDRGSTTLASWTPFAVNSLIYRNKLNIDSSNIVKIGHSAGGGYGMASWFGQNVTPRLHQDSVLNLARKVRAIVAQAPNGDFDETNYAIAAQVAVPTWVVVGANDGAYLNRSRRILAAVEPLAPGAITLTVRPGIGHSGWDDVYWGRLRMPDGRTMWQFLTAQLGKPAVAPPREVSRYEVLYFSDGSRRVRLVSGIAQNIQLN